MLKAISFSLLILFLFGIIKIVLDTDFYDYDRTVIASLFGLFAGFITSIKACYNATIGDNKTAKISIIASILLCIAFFSFMYFTLG